MLVIDADHECTSSEVLRGEPLMLLADKLGHTLHHLLRSMIYRDFEPESVRSFVLKAECAAAEVCPRLFVMPCSVRIDEFHSNTTAARKALPEGEFAGVWKKRRTQLRRWLRDSFDFTDHRLPAEPLQARAVLIAHQRRDHRALDSRSTVRQGS